MIFSMISMKPPFLESMDELYPCQLKNRLIFENVNKRFTISPYFTCPAPAGAEPLPEQRAYIATKSPLDRQPRKRLLYLYLFDAKGGMMGTSTQLGSISGYLAKPAGSGPWPGLIVIQEWWGLDAQTKSIADRFAAEGYLAFAPDLYHGDLAQLGDGQTAMALVQKHGPGAPAELQKVYDALKNHPDCTGKVGSVGFCFGGRMSLALGIGRPLDAVCTFYGGGMQELFDQLDSLKSPVLGMFG